MQEASPSASTDEPSPSDSETDLSRPSGPWTPQELEALADSFESAAEASLGEAWLAQLEDDPEGLWSYVDEAIAAGPQQVVSPLTAFTAGVGEDPATHYLPPAASEMVGMGTWRMKGNVDPVIEFLVARLEGAWRNFMDDDLCLYPSDQWKDQGYDLCDSMDPTNEMDGWAYADVPPPEKGEEGYPRLILENRIYCSRVFRKLHLEVGARQDGLQVLHMVMYPRYTYDLPILAADLVVVNGRVTLAIVDACPVSANQSLPHHYMKTMALLQEHFLADASNARSIPEWGQRIFSPLCVCISPKTPEELSGFVKYLCALHVAHLQLAQRLGPVAGVDKRSQAKREELLAAHKRFVDNQLANKKTTRVLEAAFGAEWTEQYMTKIMFDFDPSYNPPYYDASIEKLYDYFEHNPELGVLAEEQMRMEQEAASEKAYGYLRSLAAGEPVSPARVEEAMQFMYDNDPEFAASVDALLPNIEELQGQGLIGKTLARQLQAIAGYPLEEEEDDQPAAGETVDATATPAAAAAGAGSGTTTQQ